MSCTVGVTTEVGLTTDRDLSVLKKHNIYSSEIPEVMWYEPLYNNNSSLKKNKQKKKLICETFPSSS